MVDYLHKKWSVLSTPAHNWASNILKKKKSKKCKKQRKEKKTKKGKGKLFHLLQS